MMNCCDHFYVFTLSSIFRGSFFPASGCIQPRGKWPVGHGGDIPSLHPFIHVIAWEHVRMHECTYIRPFLAEAPWGSPSPLSLSRLSEIPTWTDGRMNKNFLSYIFYRKKELPSPCFNLHFTSKQATAATLSLLDRHLIVPSLTPIQFPRKPPPLSPLMK